MLSTSEFPYQWWCGLRDTTHVSHRGCTLSPRWERPAKDVGKDTGSSTWWGPSTTAHTHTWAGEQGQVTRGKPSKGKSSVTKVSLPELPSPRACCGRQSAQTGPYPIWDVAREEEPGPTVMAEAEGSSLMEYEPCCSLAELDAPEKNQQQAGTDEQRMRWEAWSGLAPVQPCWVGVQAGARRGSRKEAAKPIQPRDALSSPHGSTLHTELCHGCTNSCALHSLPNFLSAHCQKKQPGSPFASSTEEKKGKKKKGVTFLGKEPSFQQEWVASERKS